MEILFLDAAANLGFAYGPPGQCPVSGSVEVWDKESGEPLEIGAGRLARWLVAHIRRRRPDLIGIEHAQSSGALRSGKGNAASTDAQLGFYYLLHGLCGVYGINTVSPWPATIRSMVCGKAYASKVFDPVKKKIVQGDTKEMVRDCLVLIGFVPKGCRDFDKCDATAGHVWASAVHGKSAPPLVLRG